MLEVSTVGSAVRGLKDPWKRLEAGLTPEEVAAFRRLLRGRDVPFGPNLGDDLDVLIMEADDDEMELLMKCASLLEPEASDLPPVAPPPVSHHVFTFLQGAPELGHFLGSLRQNGYTVSVVDGPTVAVHVWLEERTENEAFQKRMLLSALLDLTRMVRGRNPKGRRVY
jgi:hypothetical protein